MRRFLLVFAVFVARPCFATQWAVPYTPAQANTVLQRVPVRTDPRVRAFDDLRARLGEQPDNLKLAIKLCKAYIDYGRGTGDARYLGRAEAVIRPWLKQDPAPVSALLMHATILQSKHFFAQSRSLLQAILKREPHNSQAWLTLATVAQVQGDMATARHACSHLLGVSDPLVPGACLASLSAVTGRAGEAYDLLQLLLPQTKAASPAVQAWFQGIMADTAKYLGNRANADMHYRAALQLTPGDNFLLADYADFLLDRRRPRAALKLVRDYSASDTSFLRQVFAEIDLGLPQAKADTAIMARRFEALDRRGSRTYRREQAMFVLHAQHDPRRALHLAIENWTVQRTPKDARIFLAAALAAGQPAAAQPVLDLLTRTHLQDPVLNRLAARARRELAHNGALPTSASSAAPVSASSVMPASTAITEAGP